MTNHDQGEIPQKIDKLRDVMYSRALSPLIHQRERRALSHDPDMVPHDWKREEPELEQTLVAPRGLDTTRSILKWLILVAFLFFLGASGYFAYYFTVGGGSDGTSARNIGIVIQGPSQITSGSKTELQIAISNRNAEALKNVELVVMYPVGTRSPVDYSSAQPEWIQSLGTLNPGEVRRGVANAVFNGVQGTPGSVKVEIKYQVDGSSAIFEASDEYAFTYGSTPITVTVDGNSETVSGQPVMLTATVSSNATAPIKDARVTLQLPFGFKMTDIHPAIDDKSVIYLGDINPGDQKKITLQGVLTGAEGDQRIFTFMAGTYSGASSTPLDVPLAVETHKITVAQPFLDMNLALGDMPATKGQPLIIKPGEKITSSITYKNNLTTPITNATVIARFSGTQLDGTTITSPDGFFRSNDDTIIWNKTTAPGLQNIPPGGTGILTFSFSAPSKDQLQGKGASSIDVTLSAAGSRVAESGVIESLQSVSDQKFTLSSNVELAANGLYYSSPYGTNGPMPPKVGVETTYAVVLTLLNSTNPIKDATVSGTLPVYVRATGKMSPSYEKLHFNQTSGTVTWDVGDVAANVGQNGTQPRQVAFEVGFTPSISQVGQKPDIFRDITFRGTDSVTGETIFISSTSSDQVRNVTIDLHGDTAPTTLDPAVVGNSNPSNNI